MSDTLDEVFDEIERRISEHHYKLEHDEIYARKWQIEKEKQENENTLYKTFPWGAI